MVGDQVEGIHHRIELLDALEHRARHFDRGESVLAIGVEQLARAERAKIDAHFCAGPLSRGPRGEAAAGGWFSEKQNPPLVNSLPPLTGGRPEFICVLPLL